MSVQNKDEINSKVPTQAEGHPTPDHHEKELDDRFNKLGNLPPEAIFQKSGLSRSPVRHEIDLRDIKSGREPGTEDTSEKTPKSPGTPKGNNFASIFRKGNKTTPSRERAFSVGGVGQPKKRKADGSPFINKYKTDVVERILEKIKELKEIVANNKNTKIEIKNIVGDLSMLSLKIEESERRVDEENTENNIESSEQTNLTLMEAEFTDQAVSKEIRKNTVSTQTDSADLAAAKEKAKKATELAKENERVSQIRSRLKKDRTLEETETIISENWPLKTYEHTKVLQKSIISDTASAARIVLVNSEGFKTDSRVMNLANQMQSLKVFSERRNMTEGQVICLETGESLMVTGENDGQNNKRLLVIGCVPLKPTLENLQQTLSKTLKELLDRDITSASYSPPQGMDTLMFRKLLECELCQTGIKAEIYTGRQKLPKGTTQQAQKRGERKNVPKTSTLLITAPKEKTYADTVKAMKAAISPDKIGISVEKTTKTKDGNIRMVVRERKPGARTTFVEQVTKNIQSAEVKIQSKETRVIIRDLDETITGEEIKEALTKLLDQNVDLKIGAVTKNQYGTYSAVVNLPPKAAANILKLKRIRVGWLRCRVTEKLTPIRCFKCQAFGHSAKECRENASIRRCHKCGSHEHIARECQNNPNCYVCKLEGHRADSMACPEFRQKVQIMKEEKTREKLVNREQHGGRPGPRTKNGENNSSECQ